jgi:hypothetical protein
MSSLALALELPEQDTFLFKPAPLFRHVSLRSRLPGVFLAEVRDVEELIPVGVKPTRCQPNKHERIPG